MEKSWQAEKDIGVDRRILFSTRMSRTGLWGGCVVVVGRQAGRQAPGCSGDGRRGGDEKRFGESRWVAVQRRMCVLGRAGYVVGSICLSVWVWASASGRWRCGGRWRRLEEADVVQETRYFLFCAPAACQPGNMPRWNVQQWGRIWTGDKDGTLGWLSLVSRARRWSLVLVAARLSCSSLRVSRARRCASLSRSRLLLLSPDHSLLPSAGHSRQLLVGIATVSPIATFRSLNARQMTSAPLLERNWPLSIVPAAQAVPRRVGHDSRQKSSPG